MKVTLVLLPGLNGTTGLFQPLLECLKDEVNVLPIAYPTQEKLSYIELTSYVLDKLNSIDGQYIVLGESLSGPISLVISQSKPSGLMGLILVATFVTAPNYRLGRFLPWRIGFTLTKPLYGIRLALSDDQNRSIVSAISAELQKVSPQVLAHRIQEIFCVDATHALKNCEYPVVYFRGIKDFVVPKKNLDKILLIKPDVQVVNFDTQHFLLQSKPEQASIEIKQFIERCIH